MNPLPVLISHPLIISFCFCHYYFHLSDLSNLNWKKYLTLATIKIRMIQQSGSGAKLKRKDGQTGRQQISRFGSLLPFLTLLFLALGFFPPFLGHETRNYYLN